MTFDLRASALAFAFLGGIAADLHATALPGSAQPLLGAPQNSTPQRYVRAKEGGTKVYNLADTKGVELLNAPAASLLAVYSENAGFLEVEPAGGMTVWVSGQYLETTDEPGVLKVTGSGVNMRPSPTNAIDNSYPLSRSLNKSDKVRAAGRAHAEKPMKDDWVKIWAPAGTRAWCRKSDVVDATGADAAQLFAAAQKDAHAAAKLWIEPKTAGAAPKGEAKTADAKTAKTDPKSTATDPKVVQANAEKAAKQAGPTTELSKADELYDQARTSETPDFSTAKAAYQKVVEQAPNSSAADAARAGLEKINLHEEVRRLKSDKAAMETDRQERLRKAEEDLRRASLSSDPLWGRFQARGWLERDGERWIVRWAGKVTSEVVCATGRYEFATYEGYQLGITGAWQRSATADQPGQIDVRRIEVLDGRATK